MSYKFSKFKSGFSLAELLVVVAIIIIMTGVLFASMSGNKSQKDAENAARQVAAQLRQLQNEAINGKSINGQIACYFYFNSAGSREYTTSYNDCSNDGGGTLISGSKSQPIKLNSGKGNVSMSETNIYFELPHGKHSGTSLVTFTAGDKRAYVCICKENIFDTKSPCPSC